MTTNLRRAFAALRKAGYFARMNWRCCQGCGCNAIPETYSDKYVFFHAQDNEDRKAGKDFYLGWAGDGSEIVCILGENGVRTSWNGDNEKRIKVLQ